MELHFFSWKKEALSCPILRYFHCPDGIEDQFGASRHFSTYSTNVEAGGVQ